MQAVSIGGVAFAATGCGTEARNSDGDNDVTTLDGATTSDVELDIPEADVLIDAAEDIAADADADLQDDAAEDADRDSTEPDVVPDAAQDVTVEVGEDTASDTAPEDAPRDVQPDTPQDTAEDVPPDTVADVEADTAEDVADTAPDTTDGGDPCAPEEDNVCPGECTIDNDFDCCLRFAEESGLPCFFDPGFGCSCAAVGPFNPPAVDAVRA